MDLQMYNEFKARVNYLINRMTSIDQLVESKPYS